ncbi:hypothetical protein F5X68DRAFT_248319 [Plectosphaerella plurivora]|uniref:PRISE-like Rossmann-fold domain-containing protein n=1 Tax=Plectosphaerella plurivora TaxID=936078 RepID=A0A9P9AFN4_9PEZI|nr:hypothetical protein F5X68DRAFT_248319 [Plectosphaerella plurivora]
MASRNHALVFGASGLIGWGVVNELLSGNPATNTFSKITAAVNRSVVEPEMHWPSAGPGRPDLQIATGVNLRQGSADELAAQLREEVPGIESVTHVFYFVFTAVMGDHIEECNLNQDMMKRVAGAVNLVAPKLESVVYSGGTRGYGIYIPGGTFTPPLEESMADNLPPDYEATVAYPHFRRILTEASASGTRWSWTEVCPDAVVGFTPNGSAFSLALHWAQYLSLYAFKHRGETEMKVPFPGVEAAYRSKFTPVSTRVLGRIAVHAALEKGRCSGKILNAADRAHPTTWEELWPKIVAWFGMVGVGPNDGADGPVDAGLMPGEYIAKHKHLFEEAGLHKAMSCGVGDGHQQLDSVGTWLTFDRQLSLERLRSVGFEEEADPTTGWLDSFERFRRAGIIF